MSRFLNNRSQHSPLASLLGVFVALLVFLLVPFSQLVRKADKVVLNIEQIDFAPPPPPPRVEEPPPPPPPPPEKVDPPVLNTPPPMPSLEQVELSLNPGTGGSLSLGIEMGLDFGTESAAKMAEIFGFDELDEIPRLVREGRFRYPSNSPRGRGMAYVRLLVFVETDGRVVAQEVLDYSHKEFVDAAKNLANSSRFSPPLRNGLPVRSRYEWSIKIPLR